MKTKNFLIKLFVLSLIFITLITSVPASAIPNAVAVTGDVNKDSKVSAADYLLVKKVFQNKSVTAANIKNSDINQDGLVTTVDYLIVKRIFGGAHYDFPKILEPLEAQPAINDPGNRITYTVSGVFTSNMVLQRDEVIRVWGWSNNKGGYMYGELFGETRYAKISNSGEWVLEFSPHHYTTTGTTLKIYPKNGTVTTFSNILIGDVWLVSGQSNAEYTFKEMAVYFTECYDWIDSTDNIRLYRTSKSDAHNSSGQLVVSGEQKDVINRNYKWTTTTKAAVENFSAVGYSFVKEISNHTEIPQGIVMAAAGGCVLHEFMDPVTGASYSNAGSVWVNENNSIYKYFLAPFKHMSMRGILFYQGESNNTMWGTYAEELAACVAGWRKNFDSDFTFFNVQCTSHSALVSAFPGLPALRASQYDAYNLIGDSYLISTLDVGYRLRPSNEPEEDYAHTFDKKTIGQRGAHMALAHIYKDPDFVYEYVACPMPINYTWDESARTVTIDFQNVGSGLKAYSGSLIGFQFIMGDGSTKTASAVVVDKDTVRVSMPSGTPSVLCYAYNHSALLEEANLVNSNNVPAPTFRLGRK